jgi:hypothetical protein
MRRLLALAACFTLYLIPLSAFAGSLLAQPLDGLLFDSNPGTNGHSYDEVVVHGVSGVLHSVSSRFLIHVADDQSRRISSGYIVDCGTGQPTLPTHTNQCAGGGTFGTYTYFSTGSNTLTPGTDYDTGIVDAVLDSNVTLDPSHYYTIEFQAEHGWKEPYGTATSTAAVMYAYQIGSVDDYYSSSFTPFFSLNDIGGYSPTVGSQILSIVSPIEGAIVTQTSVPFSFWYSSDCSASSTPYDITGFNVRDNTAGQDIQGNLEETVCGAHIFNHSFNLTNGHSYTWTPFLYATSATSTLYGASTNFRIDTEYVEGSTTPSVTGLPGVLQGLWNLIQNNPPFGFIFQVRNELGNISATSSPAAAIAIPDFERNYVFSPLDIGLSSLMYFVFAVWAFKRFQHFEF